MINTEKLDFLNLIESGKSKFAISSIGVLGDVLENILEIDSTLLNLIVKWAEDGVSDEWEANMETLTEEYSEWKQ